MKVEINDVQRTYSQPEAYKPRNVEEAKPKEASTEVESKSRENRGVTEKEAAKVREVVDKMNKDLEAANTEIEFKVHESKDGGINKVSIKVVDKSNDKVVVEIPSEESIEFSEKMDEITGLLFDHRG